MATRLEIEYDRKYSSADTHALIARANVTLNVFQQLGATYHSLPSIALAPYQTETEALETDVSALIDLLNQIRPLLISIDQKARPLDEKNKAALKVLSGLLNNSAHRALLDQITGPTTQSGGSTPTPPPPA